jgi:hypothetical protein
VKQHAERCAWLVTAMVLAGTTSARAQPASAPRPWEQGISAEERLMAEELFDQAVELHEQLLRDQAATRYAEALSHWENPRIRWNLALVTKDMGQYLQAHEHLERALAWGREAFDEQDWRKITALRETLLERHLAVVEARCDQSGAEIALDGKPWFRGPGSARQVVLPGEHVITARRIGYFPMARNIVLPAGTQGAVTVSLSMDGIVEQRRWEAWKPWAVVGTGMAMAVLAAGFEVKARGDLAGATRELARECGGDPSCDPATPDAYRRGLLEHRIALGLVDLAGAVVVGGMAMVFFNQPRAYRTEDRPEGSFELVPIASPDRAGVSARLRF